MSKPTLILPQDLLNDLLLFEESLDYYLYKGEKAKEALNDLLLDVKETLKQIRRLNKKFFPND